jgi:hypothetical protein
MYLFYYRLKIGVEMNIKSSFLDDETIKKHEKYAGKRVKRGLFVSASGKQINAF